MWGMNGCRTMQEIKASTGNSVNEIADGRDVDECMDGQYRAQIVCQL